VGVTVTFLANEGVMLASGETKVLIDALFQKYERGYAVPHDSTQRALASARGPFDGVDLVLVTHRHGDHFHPAPIAAHMRANAQATLVTSRQVIDSLRGRLTLAALREPRIAARTTAPGLQRREVINGVSVHLLGLPHGGRRHRQVEHLGFLVELGGRRILHVGDTDFEGGVFERLRLDTAGVDIALLPSWMVTSEEGRQVITRWIRPRQVVAFHVGIGDERQSMREVRRSMPGAVIFTRSLETRRW
jgi:L-ascorbate metabolism protein UlaG (beta-lactamase superfamily)